LIEVLRLEKIKINKSKNTILDIPDFKVFQGERVAIIGPNGAGKTTLLKVLAFLEEPCEGERYFCGEKIANGKRQLWIRRKMAAVFQNPLLLDMSVYDNVALGLYFRKFPEHDVKTKVGYWLRTLGIYNLRNQNARDLSGGEAQRVSIARALCVEPEILFLDEPFSYLDAPTRENLLVELKTIVDERQITTVFVTHDFTEIPYLATKTCVMLNGKIVQAGMPEQVLYKPSSARVAKFLGIENIYEGRVMASTGDFSEILVDNLLMKVKGRCEIGRSVKICIRSETILINEEVNKSNVFKGEVKEVYYKGSYNKLDVDIGIRIKVSTTKNIEKGQKLTVAIPEDKIHVIN